jgi:hypothetical protein
MSSSSTGSRSKSHHQGGRSKPSEPPTTPSPVKILHDQQNQQHKEGKVVETLKFLNEHLEFCGDNVAKVTC